ncbi:MAG TPA: hypothetical protein VLC09_20215, partial [Polyangiaceae bacterium]|nr:hypothetical protein [Polyangiaceae bacterium]
MGSIALLVCLTIVLGGKRWTQLAAPAWAAVPGKSVAPVLAAGSALAANDKDKPEDKPATSQVPAPTAEELNAQAAIGAGGHYGGGADEAAAFATAVLGPKGGVPVHEMGDFRSPFANPKVDPVEVSVGLVLANVPDYDIVKGTFRADFFLSLTCKKPMPKIRLTFTNGISSEIEPMADQPTFKLYRVRGEFSSLPDLHKYPFDTQELSIELEDVYNGVDMVKFKTDQEHTFLDAGFSLAGWDVDYFRARTMSHFYPDRFENDDLYYHRYTFVLGIERFATSAMFTVFVPAFVIVLISLSGLWFPRDQLEVRSNATTPMLAAAVLFHFALTQALPSVAYLTRADKLMLSVYLCLGVHMLTLWMWFVVHDDHTERIFKWGKLIGVPLTAVILG